MQALVLTLGLLVTQLATTTAMAVAVPPALHPSVSVEDPNVALPMMEPLEAMDTELYYLRQLQDMRNRMNVHRASKRFFCNPYGCI
ncbi:expressed conserved protein [Echinococcus multilocularis]|uniref:Expressed conserved protein n=1 Tax=Echinococcus multilocularis TaxID=6211 RepID=A0A087W0X0_ECHMU|nr:expressed conserved protein [Echinococcus multilocularis]